MTRKETQALKEVMEAMAIHRKAIHDSLKNGRPMPKGKLEDLQTGMDISLDKLGRLIPGRS